MIYKELINTEKTWLGRWLIGQSASCHASVNDVGSEPQNPSKFCCGSMHLLFQYSFHEIGGRDRRILEYSQIRYPGLHTWEPQETLSQVRQKIRANIHSWPQSLQKDYGICTSHGCTYIHTDKNTQTPRDTHRHTHKEPLSNKVEEHPHTQNKSFLKGRKTMKEVDKWHIWPSMDYSGVKQLNQATVRLLAILEYGLWVRWYISVCSWKWWYLGDSIGECPCA